MAKTKKDFMGSIADLLPEGMDESLINDIGKLLIDKINEEVAKVTESQTRKTLAFIRSKIDQLKEHAVKELELENETYRNAQLFETVRSLFAVELTGDDEMNATNLLATVTESQDQKIDVLVQEVDRLLAENVKLKRTGKVLSDKASMLESQLAESKQKLEEKNSTGGKNLSDKAVMVSESNFKDKTLNNDKVRKDAKIGQVNEMLTPAVLDAFKQLKG